MRTEKEIQAKKTELEKIINESKNTEGVLYMHDAILWVLELIDNLPSS